MVKHKIVRNLLRQPVTLLHMKRRGRPLTVPAKAKSVSVGPEYYETAQFKNMVRSRPGNPAFLAVIGEEMVPDPVDVQLVTVPIPAFAPAPHEVESIHTRESPIAADAKSESSKKKSKNPIAVDQNSKKS